jgi:hypothetical protein
MSTVKIVRSTYRNKMFKMGRSLSRWTGPVTVNSSDGMLKYR